MVKTPPSATSVVTFYEHRSQEEMWVRSLPRVLCFISTFAGEASPCLRRHCARAAEGMDSRFSRLRPQRVEPPRTAAPSRCRKNASYAKWLLTLSAQDRPARIDALAEWLRRPPAKPMGHVGVNSTGVVRFLTADMPDTALRQRRSRLTASLLEVSP